MKEGADIMNDLNSIILSYNEYITKIPLGCQVIADKLRVRKIESAMVDIMNFTEGINWVLKINEHLQKKSLALLVNAKKVHQFLHEINDGLVIQDYYKVADIFEYEIISFFEENLMVVEKMQDPFE